MITRGTIGQNCNAECVPCWGECKTSNGELYQARACSYRISTAELDSGGSPRVVTINAPSLTWNKLQFSQLQAMGLCSGYGYTSGNCNVQVCETTLSGTFSNWRCETATFAHSQIYPYTTCQSEELRGTIRYGFWIQSNPSFQIQIRQDFSTNSCNQREVTQTYARIKAINVEILTVHCYFFGNFRYIYTGAPGCPTSAPGAGVDFADDPFCDFLPNQYFAGTSNPKSFASTTSAWSDWIPFPTCRSMQDDGIEIGLVQPVISLSTDIEAVRSMFSTYKAPQSISTLIKTAGDVAFDAIANVTYEQRKVKFNWCNTSIPT